MVCAAIPTSMSAEPVMEVSRSTTMYAAGLSPGPGPGQSFRYAAHASVSKIFAFHSPEQDRTYLRGCRLAAEDTWRARATRPRRVSSPTGTLSSKRR